MHFHDKSEDYRWRACERKLCFDTEGGDYVVHIKEIEENDGIKIEPSYFRLFYLENSADRFRVEEDLKSFPLDYIHHLKKLWKEIENRLKSKIWSVSQIYTYWEEVKKRSKIMMKIPLKSLWKIP